MINLQPHKIQQTNKQPILLNIHEVKEIFPFQFACHLLAVFPYEIHHYMLSRF